MKTSGFAHMQFVLAECKVPLMQAKSLLLFSSSKGFEILKQEKMLDDGFTVKKTEKQNDDSF